MFSAADIIRASGANSISMGRTPHECHDEMCRELPLSGAASG